MEKIVELRWRGKTVPDDIPGAGDIIRIEVETIVRDSPGAEEFQRFVAHAMITYELADDWRLGDWDFKDRHFDEQPLTNDEQTKVARVLLAAYRHYARQRVRLGQRLRELKLPGDFRIPRPDTRDIVDPREPIRFTVVVPDVTDPE